MAAAGASCLPPLYDVTSPPLRLRGLLSVTPISPGSLALVSNYPVAAPIPSHLHLAPGEQYLVRCRAFIYIENGGRFDILKDLPN